MSATGLSLVISSPIAMGSHLVMRLYFAVATPMVMRCSLPVSYVMKVLGEVAFVTISCSTLAEKQHKPPVMPLVDTGCYQQLLLWL